MAKTTDQTALDEWYVVGAMFEIADGKSRRTRLLGQDIVIAADPQGRPTCREIAPDRPVAHVAEHYDFIWVCLGEPRRGIVEVAEISDPERRYIQRGRIGIATSGPRIIENFFDMSHFSFIHTGTLGGQENPEVPRYKVTFREDEEELWATECRFFQPKPSAEAGQGIEILYNYRVTAPNICIIYKDSPSRAGARDVIGLFIQPRDETDSVVHAFVAIYDRANSDTGLIHFYHEIFVQDRSVLIHQVPRKLPLMPRREIPTVSDAMSVAYRKWLDKSGLQFGVDRTAA
jgi:phenylpropionate dioxygenase-like ring-hydroxylating dioxygenase large terminal subunit